MSEHPDRPIVDRYGTPIDYSELDERFTEFFRSGERVEVTWKEGFEDYTGHVGNRTGGRKSRFYVGISGGRKPVYLQIANTRSLGGPAICSAGVESIAGTGVYREGGRPWHRPPWIKSTR